MSCDYDVYCESCKSHLGVSDANHGQREMNALIQVRENLEIIGACAALLRKLSKETPSLDIELIVKNSHYAFDVAWFAEHKGHPLRVIDEYGRFSDQCFNHVKCGSCDVLHWCVLRSEHEGPCTGKMP